ncbi:MAG: hypothetical protein EXR62_14600 [Chloroflexi bacterium]|nr:hypothetical protein [Chloroflexota bacterium]
MKSMSFERFAGWCAILAGITIFLYAVAFVVLRNMTLYSLLLLLNGLLTTAIMTALYLRLRETDGAFALWAILLGFAGAVGAAVHGGYDLANAINPPATPIGDFPSQIDPRGLLTFGVAGIGMFLISWLMVQNAQFPRNLGMLGYLFAVLLVIIYLARLTILDPANPVLLIPVLLSGFIVNPLWNIWLGMVLMRGQGATSSARMTETTR